MDHERLEDIDKRLSILESRNGHGLDELRETVAWLEWNARNGLRMANLFWKVVAGVAVAVVAYLIGVKP